MLYRLSYADWDDYSPNIIEGPEVPDWKAFCDSLLPEACDLAIANRNDSWVGWRNVVEAMVSILETKGYTRLRPTEAMYVGSGIIHSMEDMGFDDNIESDRFVQRTPELEAAAQRMVDVNQLISDELYQGRKFHGVVVEEEPSSSWWKILSVCLFFAGVAALLFLLWHRS